MNCQYMSALHTFKSECRTSDLAHMNTHEDAGVTEPVDTGTPAGTAADCLHPVDIEGKRPLRALRHKK